MWAHPQFGRFPFAEKCMPRLRASLEAQGWEEVVPELATVNAH
jgi:hypothetical protein